MSVTYTPGLAARDDVRLLIGDTDVSAAVFEDEELDVLLTLEGANTYRAAAQALDTMASSQVMLLKVVKVMDVTTDGAKVSQELRARADALRVRAGELEAAEEDGSFAVAEMTVNHFAWRDGLWNAAVREV